VTEAIYADSATKDIKFVNPDIISKTRALEQRLNNVKREIGPLTKNTGYIDSQVSIFMGKWMPE
jgi:hypothetical protein